MKPWPRAILRHLRFHDLRHHANIRLMPSLSSSCRLQPLRICCPRRPTPRKKPRLVRPWSARCRTQKQRPDRLRKSSARSGLIGCGGQGLNLRPSGYEAPDEGLQAGSNSCKPLETLDSSGGHSEAAMQAVSSEHKDLASRWSAAVSREFSMKVPTTACSLPHRRRLASMSPSTCFAEPALRGVSNTGGS